MSLSKREQDYIQARLEGATEGEAAGRAGYTDRPPARVRKLASRALLLRAEPEVAASYEQRREEAQAKIDTIRRERLRPLYAELARMTALATIAEMVLEAQRGQTFLVPSAEIARKK